MKKMQERKSPEEILDEKIDKLQRGREWKRGIWELLIFLVIVYLCFAYIIGFAVIKGNSMAPALQEDEVLLFYRMDSQYHPGDVVIFRQEGQVEYVKRIVATQGDEVDLDEETGALLINGEAAEEPYIYTETRANSGKVTFPLKVEAGQVFVLGDNREASLDSRDFGCVDVDDITGRVLLHFGQVF